MDLIAYGMVAVVKVNKWLRSTLDPEQSFSLLMNQ